MKNTKTTLIKETAVDDQDSKAVLAYRVGQLETATRDGLKEVKDELHNLKDHFVTVKDLADAKEAGNVKHAEQDGRLSKLESWNEWAVKIVLLAVFGAILSLVIAKSSIAF